MPEREILNAAIQLDRAREKRRLTSITHAGVVRGAMAEFATRHAYVYVWLAMPDHLHVLFSPRQTAKNAADLVGRIKHAINQGLARRGMAKLQWREAVIFYDVPPGTALSAREYILQNPVRGLLVEQAQDWPHRGAPEDLPYASAS